MSEFLGYLLPMLGVVLLATALLTGMAVSAGYIMEHYDSGSRGFVLWIGSWAAVITVLVAIILTAVTP